jgi:polysaccharide biosynthesis/export protein
MAGKGGDVPLQADDILFIPNSMAKSATLRSVEAAIQVTTGLSHLGQPLTQKN